MSLLNAVRGQLVFYLSEILSYVMNVCWLGAESEDVKGLFITFFFMQLEIMIL